MVQSDERKRYPFHRPGIYRIRVLGSIDENWSERLGNLRIKAGRVRDQAELAGLLNSLYELHLTLLSVEML